MICRLFLKYENTKETTFKVVYFNANAIQLKK